MTSVNHIGKGRHFLSIGQPDLQPFFQIDVGNQLALPQIGDDHVAFFAADKPCNTVAGAAVVEAENQPRLLPGSAVNPGMHAQSPVLAMQCGLLFLEELETRPPDQRTVAKHPKITHNHTTRELESLLPEKRSGCHRNPCAVESGSFNG